MKLRASFFTLLAPLAALLPFAALSLSAAERPRPAVLTDVGTDPEDQQTAAAPKWQQSVIDQAVEAKLVKFSSGLKWENNILVTSAAMYFLALASHYDPEVKSTSGIKVSDRFLEQIRSMIAGGNEPGCLGALGGWADNSAAQALALARHTPAVWNKLSAGEKTRCDFVMQALAVVGNYMQNAENYPKSDMSQVRPGSKTVNPNFQEGYVGIMSAAFIYFGGADNTDRIFAKFKYNDYVAAMDAYGFTNMKKNYTAAGRSLLEAGGKDGLGGTVRGAKIPFTYRDILTKEKVPYEPFLIFRSLASKMYMHTVQSRLVGRREGEAYIADKSTSPFEGQVGMCFEFKAVDAEGLRSSATYVFHGWRNSVATRATIEALGYWGTSEGHQDVERRMYVGSEDFIYKLVHGWRGFKHGAPEGPTTEKTRVVGVAYTFFKDIWQAILSNADRRRPAGRPPVSTSRL